MKSQLLALLLIVPAILNGEEVSLEDYKGKFNAPKTNRYYYARLIAESGDPGIRWLLARAPGSDDGELEKAIGIGLVFAPVDVLPYIKPMLKDRNPQTRAFAVSVAAQLVDERFIPLFKALSADKTELPIEWMNTSVADCVKDAMWMYEWKEKHTNCFNIHRESDFRKAKELEPMAQEKSGK